METTIGLNDRYQNARKNGADILFVHADGFRSVKGASVFIWSEEASSTSKNLSDKSESKFG